MTRGMRADELFIFAGAGVSRSVPAGLPLFPAIRNELLTQLGLGKYLPPPPGISPTEQQQVAAGLTPEPFILALQRSGAQVIPWLHDVLAGGLPNAAHAALAELAATGARVWTVNFDTLIEQAAADRLRTCAWPQDPSAAGQLFKPHGTLTGQLIINSEQVLRGLSPEWERQLRSDVRGRTVVFVGYSGRDLDFQPPWDNVLHESGEVYWFDLPDPYDQHRKKILLRSVDADGRLHFPAGSAGTPAGHSNPSWDFVVWCQHHGLIDVDANLVARLLDKAAEPGYPPLGRSSPPFPRAATQQILGDIQAARRTYLNLLIRGPQRQRAANELKNLTLNHGGRRVGAVLIAGRLVPPVGRAKDFRAVAQRKRATILSNCGRHAAVLRETTRLPPEFPSTLLILRASALWMTDSLDEAAVVAATAMQRALREGHPVRAAHAAFQRGLSLAWAYRIEEAIAHLQDHQRPYASIAATRWVAWADFVEAVLEIYCRHLDQALLAIDAGAARFRAEALVDGQIDMETIRLTALRLAGDDEAFVRQRQALDRLTDPANRQGTRYARAHRFTREAIALEDAEFARTHQADPAAAEAHYRFVAGSEYRIHAALGNLGLAALQVQRGIPPSHAEVAMSLGRQITARLIVSTAQRLLGWPVNDGTPPEMFFP